MQRETQISAVVSATTRMLLDKHVQATGIKKSHLIEEAILHHVRALEALPADVIVHPRLVVSRRSGEEIANRLKRPRRPTKLLRALMRNDGD